MLSLLGWMYIVAIVLTVVVLNNFYIHLLYNHRLDADCDLKRIPHQICSKDKTHDEKSGTFAQLPLCSLISPNLVGSIGQESILEARQSLTRVHHGGTHSPPQCQSRDKVAIIIPFRNRTEHLSQLLPCLHLVLQRQQLEYTIFVVELSLPLTFNKGAVNNVGYKIARASGNFTCYIFHDVDLIPVNDLNLYRCETDRPCQLSTAIDRYNFKLPYADNFGGVIAFTREQFEKVNGFSNLYFGWGGEDDDLRYRVKEMTFPNNSTKGNEISRRPGVIGRYLSLSHERDDTNPCNKVKDSLNKLSKEHIPYDGLNSVTYSVKESYQFQLFTYNKIQVKSANILKRLDFYKRKQKMLFQQNSTKGCSTKSRARRKQHKTRQTSKFLLPQVSMKEFKDRR